MIRSQTAMAAAFAAAVSVSASLTFAAPAQAASYVRVCNNGALEGNATCPTNPKIGPGQQEWGCTWDKATQLLWEVKAKTGTRAYNNFYRNFDNPASPQKQGGQKPTVSDINFQNNSIGFVTYVNGAGLCTHKNWRRPTLIELRSLVIKGGRGSIDPTYFPEATYAPAPMLASATITSTAARATPSSYTGITFANGTNTIWPRQNGSYIRLVTSWDGKSSGGGGEGGRSAVDDAAAQAGNLPTNTDN